MPSGIKRFDGTMFQNWKHGMELMFEFKDVKGIVEVIMDLDFVSS